MSRDIRIELSEDDIQSIKDWHPYYTSQSNCDIEIITDKEWDCIYCEWYKYKWTHFLCEVCWIWMCDNCYNNDIEHNWHYHRVCENTEDDLYNKIIKKIWHEPDYICEKCLWNIEN